MLFAKITPETSGSYLTILKTTTMIEGTGSFDVLTGNIETGSKNPVKFFHQVSDTPLDLSGSIPAKFDTDQVAFYNTVATQLGYKVESTLTGDPLNY